MARDRFIIIPVGIPGSGKSTLREEYKRNYPGLCVISPDDIRMEMLDFERTGISFDQKIEDDVWKRSFDELDACIAAGRNIYFDATNLTINVRRLIIERVDKEIYTVIAIYLDIDPDVAISRIKARKRKVPLERIIKMDEMIEKPTTCEGFDTVMITRTGECH